MDFTWQWAALFTRVIVGLIFGMAGFWKVFTLTPLGHAHRHAAHFSAHAADDPGLDSRRRG